MCGQVYAVSKTFFLTMVHQPGLIILEERSTRFNHFRFYLSILAVVCLWRVEQGLILKAPSGEVLGSYW